MLTRVKIHFPVKLICYNIDVLKGVKLLSSEKYVNVPGTATGRPSMLLCVPASFQARLCTKCRTQVDYVLSREVTEYGIKNVYMLTDFAC